MSTILITVDALRADHLGQYGYFRDTMPVLQRLSGDGMVFKEAFSNGPFTRVSIPSIHSSRYLGHRELTNVPTIASVLRNHDVYSACIGTLTGFRDVETGLDFDEYHRLGRDTPPELEDGRTVGDVIADKLRPGLQGISPVYQLAKKLYDGIYGTHVVRGYASAEEVTDTAIQWIEKHSEEEFFLWIHYMEGHRAYGIHDDSPEYLENQLSPRDIRELMKRAGTKSDEVTVKERRLLLDLYDSDLRYCSDHMGRLFDELEGLGLWPELNVIFTSDHGEEFYDHGLFFHRNLPYDELIHVPLILKSPAVNPSIIETQRELLDVAPTICSLEGGETVDTFQGDDLRDGGKRRVFSTGASSYSEVQTIGARWDGWKFIQSGESTFLFDLENDPMERRSVATNHPEKVRMFQDAIPGYLLKSTPIGIRSPTDGIDERQLEALGYLEIGK